MPVCCHVKWNDHPCVCVCACHCLSINVFVWVGTCKLLPSCPSPLFTFSSTAGRVLYSFPNPVGPAVSECWWPPSCTAVPLLHFPLQLLLLLHFSGELTDLEVLLKLNLETPKSERDEKDAQSWCASTFGVPVYMPLTASNTVSCWDFLPFWLHSLQSKVSFIWASVQQLLMYKVKFPLLIASVYLAESPVALSFVHLLPLKQQKKQSRGMRQKMWFYLQYLTCSSKGSFMPMIWWLKPTDERRALCYIAVLEFSTWVNQRPTDHL